MTTKQYYATVEGEEKYRKAISLIHGGDTEQGYRMLFEASAYGCEDADRMLGLTFVRQDGEGRRCLRNAVEQRDPGACAGICRLYDRGFPGISADMAEECCRVAAEAGDTAMKHRLEIGFDRDPEEEQLQKAIRSGDADALYRMWQLCLAKNREEEFHVYFAQAVECGQIDTLMQAARWTGDPEYQSYDPELSHEFYQMAADKGNTEAMLALGDEEVRHSAYHFFETASSDPVVREEHEKQFRWYLRAAKANDPLAILYVGCAYEHGYPADEDLYEAFRWFSKGAYLHDRECALRAAVCCENGFGTDVNAAMAASFRHMAAER